MEGVGARLGRSSSRYGTTTVFNGPVRKWKKDWVPVNPSSSSSSSSSSANNSHHHHHHHHNNNNNHHNHSSANGAVNGGSNGSAVSHLRLYKWTPLNKDNNSNSNDNDGNKIGDGSVKSSSEVVVANGSKDSLKEDDNTVSEEPPRRKFKYIPIAVLEEQKKETEENTDDEDEAKPVDSEDNTGEQASKSDGNDEKPDINDTPMEENQDVEENQTPPARQDLNELDLSLGLTSHDEELDSDSKTDSKKDAQLESSNSGA